MEAAQIPWRPIGELFVEKGLISADELEQALAEQAATGLRLGEILVKRNLISSPELTQALMEQLGREVAKEEGFGSGLWSEIRRRNARDEGRAPGEAEPDRSAFGGGLTRKLGVVSDELPGESDLLGEADLDDIRPLLHEPASGSLEGSGAGDDPLGDGLREAQVEIAALVETVAERDRSLAQLQVELDLLIDAASRHENERVDTQEVADELDAVRNSLRAEQERTQKLEAAAADREGRLAELQESLDETERRHARERFEDEAVTADRQALERELVLSREYATKQDATVSDLSHRLAGLESTLATEREARAETRRSLDDALSRADQTSRALEEVERGFKAATAERDAARTEAQDVRERLNGQEEQFAALHDELNAATSELKEERHAHGQTRKQKEQLQAGAERASTEQKRLEAELAHATSTAALNADRLQHEKAELAERADKLERKLRASRNDKTDLEAQLTTSVEQSRELTDRVADLTRQLDTIRIALADERATSQSARTAAAARLSDAEARIGELGATIEQLEESGERVRVLEQRRTAVESQFQDATARLAEEAASHSETRRVLAQALEELSGRQPEAVLDAMNGPDDHLCFVAGTEGYRLISRTGPFPTPGDEYDVDGARYTVTRIGRSPLPFDARRCVYLLAVG